MSINLKFGVIFSLAAVVVISVAAVKPDPPKYTNLKVLPKNVSSKVLQGIMTDDFEDGLGVGCNFCHANNKDGHGLDFASDAKPKKGNCTPNDADDIRHQ